MSAAARAHSVSCVIGVASPTEAVALGLVQRAFGNQRPGGATRSAFRDVAREPGDARRPARQRVDMLVGRETLRRVDRQRMAEARQQPAGFLVGKAAPVDVRNLPFRRPDLQAAVALGEDLNDVAVVADLAFLTPNAAPCPAEEPHPVAPGQGQVVFASILVDRFMKSLGGSNLAPLLQSRTDRLADICRVLVRGRADGDAALAPGREQDVPSLNVEVGDLTDNLVAIAAEKTGMAVLSFHLQGVAAVAFPEERGDLAAAPGRLPNGREQDWQGFRRKGAPQQFDAVASLDGLGLLRKRSGTTLLPSLSRR